MTPFKGMIVEGTSGVGKSTIIDALLRKHAAAAEPRRIRSVLHLAQSHTSGPLAWGEDDGTLTVADNRSHLERIVGTIEWLHHSVQRHRKPWCFAILDTLHLTHCVRPGVVKWNDVAAYDQRLAELGCKLVFLRVNPETIWERGLTPRVNEQFLLEYASKFGKNLEEIHRYFVQEQERLEELFERSAMPKLLVHNDAQEDNITESVYRFWRDEDLSQAAA
jgi:thiamine kinase-like enzyme